VFCTKKGYFLETKRSLPANNLIWKAVLKMRLEMKKRGRKGMD
jgi:hypothetical protein